MSTWFSVLKRTPRAVAAAALLASFAAPAVARAQDPQQAQQQADLARQQAAEARLQAQFAQQQFQQAQQQLLQGQPIQLQPAVQLPQRGQPQVVVVRQLQNNANARRMLGVLAIPVDDTLRSHLKLPAEVGLVVEHILPASPADKAGLQRHDVLESVNDQPLKLPHELMVCIEKAGDKAVVVKLIRAGVAQTVEIQPAPLAEEEVDKLKIQFDVVRDAVEEAARNAQRVNVEAGHAAWQAIPGDENGNFIVRYMGPGAVAQPHGGNQLPKGMSVTMTKNGAEPAKLTVKRGDETWDVTEKDLERLPPEVRVHVERMLGREIIRFGGTSRGLIGVPAIPAKPAVPGQPNVIQPNVLGGGAQPPVGHGGLVGRVPQRATSAAQLNQEVLRTLEQMRREMKSSQQRLETLDKMMQRLQSQLPAEEPATPQPAAKPDAPAKDAQGTESQPKPTPEQQRAADE